ncbi:MAG TPA: bifunctional oligoribonuclease/PAP phosphatase NrnA [Methylomirabilota bacterium]|jgi:nanoRNase/pAp phosphatase (c-di-AMP/oligoRNAs hydrolase)|nr:bifunctional oligoribonuclease/PAP phosphatase NrnA [Methylomirabilota bacterium]
MRAVLICPDDLLEQLLGSSAFPGERAVYVFGRNDRRARPPRGGDRVLTGDLQDPALYSRALKNGRGPVVVAANPARFARIVAAVNEAAPETPVLVIREDERPLAGATTVSLASFGERVVQPALDRACQRARAERIRAHFAGAERILILIQDDPDPDAIASAMALKTLLGRSRVSAPICTFGTITRPENVAMCKILDIEVQEISAHALDQFDHVAMVDVQPSFLEERFEEVDLVIDHHPVEHPIRARIKDVRPSYGATSTILVEYLRAMDIKITQRLATALLYGIKSDTLGLERGGSKADLEAFAFLYMLANHNALRRIERPELSDVALDVLAQGLAKRQILKGVFFSHLGNVPTVDQIPQFADFGLQAEGVEWSVVSGVVGSDLHISVRNVGYVKSAGDVTRAAFGDLGSAGGHRTMAKAVMPLREFLKGAGESPTARAYQERIIQRFLRALGENGKGGRTAGA